MPHHAAGIAASRAPWRICQRSVRFETSGRGPKASDQHIIVRAGLLGRLHADALAMESAPDVGQRASLRQVL
eukprot:5561696-Pyramimonas_sp.AAC.1